MGTVSGSSLAAWSINTGSPDRKCGRTWAWRESCPGLGLWLLRLTSSGAPFALALTHTNGLTLALPASISSPISFYRASTLIRYGANQRKASISHAKRNFVMRQRTHPEDRALVRQAMDRLSREGTA